MRKVIDGFLQEPRTKDTAIGLIHLEDVITHKASKNIYRIKEIQTKGFLAYIHTSTIIAAIPPNQKFYIPIDLIKEYQLGKEVI